MNRKVLAVFLIICLVSVLILLGALYIQTEVIDDNDTGTSAVENACVKVVDVNPQGDFKLDNVSIINKCNRTIDLSGWWVEDAGDLYQIPYKFPLEGDIVYNEIILLSTRCCTTNSSVICACFQNQPRFECYTAWCFKDWLGYGGDCARLFDENSIMVDEICWGSAK